MRRYLVLVFCLLLTLGLTPVAAAQSSRHRDPQLNSGQFLPVPPEEVNVNLPAGDIPYHELAPRLNALRAQSNRLRLEVTGKSAGGRDLYLVTVSDPSAFGRLGSYQALRHLMISNPEKAQQLASQFADFKVPIFINCSIHGNEYEGVDACMELIERLATQDDPETRLVLDNTVVYFNVVQNPDGRVLGQRANANGFDINRDFITQSQPEAQITARLLNEIKPMVMLDLHGYVNPMLIEPTTPPHNPNYEYDLYIKWALAQAEAMEAELFAQTGLGAQIPFRDTDEGWDDWPPIFTPMFAMYHGSYGHTLETPRLGAATSKAAHVAAVWGALKFASQNRMEMVLDQMEIFRRGFFDEPQVPIGDEYGEQHEFLADFPEAYVIPTGSGQASDLAAARLVQFMLDNGVEVERAATAFTADGKTYPAGSYVVSMTQPYRGLANTILEPGWDISDVVTQMYDISGWSLGELWGATVERIENPFAVTATPVKGEVRVHGDLPTSARAAGYAFEVDSEVAIRAANEMLADGVTLYRAADGRLVVPRSEVAGLRAYAQQGIVFTPVSSLSGLAEVEAPRIAVSGGGDAQFVLRELGFDYEVVSNAALNGDFDLSGFDILYVDSGSVRYQTLNATGRAKVDAFLASGGDVVGAGFDGARFNDEAGLVDVEYDAGSTNDNGVVNVVTAASSTIVPDEADDTAFVYRPVWFTDVAAGVTVDQTYSSDDVLLAGHWIGQEEAEGAALTVSDEVGGSRVVLFGTEPLFRAHPKKHFSHVANAFYWAVSD